MAEAPLLQAQDLARHYTVSRGLFKPPVFLQLIYGILGGIGPDIDNLHFMKRTADRLFGNDYLWSVLAALADELLAHETLDREQIEDLTRELLGD